MSLQDHTKPENARCSCGHSVVAHQFLPATKTLPAANRGPCTVQNAAGKCPMPGAAMTPDTEVWIATARAGTAYHLIRDDGRKTTCGRFVGREGRVDRGVVIYLAKAVELFASKPCKACVGSAERVQPTIIHRWEGP